LVRALLGTDGSPEQQHVWLCCGLVRAQMEEENVRQRKCVDANHLTLGGGDARLGTNCKAFYKEHAVATRESHRREYQCKVGMSSGGRQSDGEGAGMSVAVDDVQHFDSVLQK
jgi:hypothetical protein